MPCLHDSLIGPIHARAYPRIIHNWCIFLLTDSTARGTIGAFDPRRADMTQTETLLRRAYRDTGLALLGISFAQAMGIRAIRIALALRVSDWQQHGERAPIQPALI